MNISKVNQCLWKHRTSHKYRCVHWSCVIWCSGCQRHHRHPVGWHTTNTCLCCATMPYTGSSCVFVWCMPFMPTYKWQWTMYVHIIFPLVTNTHAYIFNLFVTYVKSGQCLLATDDIIIITRAATNVCHTSVASPAGVRWHNASQLATAAQVLEFLSSPTCQQAVVYKLGLEEG